MKTYQVGLIGAGFMAKAHSIAYDGMPMFFWPAPGMAVKKTIADLTEECAKDAAQRLGFRQGTANWRDIVDDPEIDIVDICTPNDAHYEIASQNCFLSIRSKIENRSVKRRFQMCIRDRSRTTLVTSSATSFISRSTSSKMNSLPPSANTGIFSFSLAASRFHSASWNVAL